LRDIFDVWRRAAKQIDWILTGISPADIPIEQPTKFDLIINRRGARDLAIVLTPLLLARADETID
jgi:putative tryptophan/tyrosine transport system substrate-binding protein